MSLFREILTPWASLRRITKTHELVDGLHRRFTALETIVARMDSKMTAISGRLEDVRMDCLFLAGQAAAKAIPQNVERLQQAEFRAFSQWGEDGIIQYLVRALHGHIDTSFIEFGVQSYMESNTLFLLMNNGWRGLVIDGEKSYIESINSRDLWWRYLLKTRCEFISRDNINDIFREEGFGPELGILSIDVDGIDWYLWEALTTRAAIIIVEYNPNFPINLPITVPYEPKFSRAEKHPSNRYYGASLAALNHLALAKGYKLVGVESHHRNAFFVRQDLAEHVITSDLTPSAVHYDAEQRFAVLKGLPFFNVVTRQTEAL